MRRRIRDLRLVLGLTALAVTLGQVSTAGADTAAPVWTCRASLAYLELGGMQRIEPVVANGNPNDIANPDRGQCVDADAGFPFIAIPPGAVSDPGQIQLQAPYAKTTIVPELGNARDQKAHAEAGAASLHIVDGTSAVQIGVDAVQATADGSCVNGKPALKGSSLVAGLTLGGMQIPIPDPSAPTVIDASPLAKISLNQEIKTGTPDTANQALVERAVQVELGPGTPDAVNVVAGEAKVDGHNFVCAAPPPTTTSSTGPTSSTGGSSTAPVPVLVNGINGGCGHLTMFFNTNRRTALSTRYGRRQVLRGRIVSCAGKPIIRAKVDVYHIVSGRKVTFTKTGLRSRPGGLLTLILPLNMTTRTLIFEYRPDLNSDRVGSRQTLHLTVRNRFGKILRGPGPGSNKAKP
jgi:hypothetical protein